MKSNVLSALSILVGVLMGGCGDNHYLESDEMDPLEARETAPPAEETVLNELEVFGQRLEFIELKGIDDTETLLMVHSVADSRERDVIDVLAEENGPLTLLEMFSALAPEGTSPHRALVRSHRREAMALGRTDVETVVGATLSRSYDQNQADALRLLAAFPTNYRQTCQNAIFQNTVSTVWTRVVTAPHTLSDEPPADNAFLCAGGAGGLFVPSSPSFMCNLSRDYYQQPLRVGLCHGSFDSPSTVYQFAASFQGSPMSFSTPRTLVFGQNAFTTYSATSALKRAAVVNYPSAPNYAYMMGSGIGEPR